MTDESEASRDRGPTFDGVKIGRPAVGALIEAGYKSLLDLPANIDDLKNVHGVGPKALKLLKDARTARNRPLP
ncbi:DNA-binding protein [uncultured Arthrobacter sp.]|uniref:DNA-binding protein n=1 Tax=uncultured Arthrobacter sp. TaxID=114050 RepID=UPI0026031D39|nr:DNA-binding protein [uncultured Arthrobacter sp.]